MGSALPLLIAILLSADSTIAGGPRLVDWNDLRPSEELPDPFRKLDSGQLRDLGHLLRLRRLIAAEKIPASGPDSEEADAIEQRLRAASIDIERLISQRRIVRQLRESQGFAVRQSLDHEVITIAGFVVPLTRSGNLVTEFLLVPAFDYCCSVTPPPPNQAIYVRSDDGIEVSGRFAAAQVCGRISVTESRWITQRDEQPVEFIAAYALSPQSISVHVATR